MNIGTLVYQENQGNLRFGTITGKELDEKGWAWFAVDWHNDVRHARATNWTTKLRNDGIDRYNRTYRADELTLISSEHLSRAVTAHGSHAHFRTPELPAC
jgi:hypothetical protein